MANLAQDTFTRTVSTNPGGWGSASDGVSGSYTQSSPTLNIFSVNGTQGVIAMAAGAQARYSGLNSVSQLQCEVSADFTFSAAVTGTGTTGLVMGVEARRSGNSTGNTLANYRVKVLIPASGQGNTRLRVSRTASNVETTIGSDVNFGTQLHSHQGQVIHIKMQVSGTGTTTIKGKIWVGSDPEPTTWLISETDSTGPQVAGGIGIHTAQASGVGTESITVDNFSADSLTVAHTIDVPSPSVLTATATPPDPGTDLTYYVTDTFSRVSGSTLGTAEVGGAYTAAFTNPTTASVNGDMGVMTNGASLIGGGYLRDVSERDIEVSVQYKLSQALSGSGYYGLYLRTNDSASLTDFFRIRCRVGTAGYLEIQGHAFTGGSSTQLSPYYLTSIDPNNATDTVYVKAKITGASPTTLRCKAWILGTPEPDWQFVVSTSSGPQVAGGVGLFTQNTTSVTYSTYVDNFIVYDPPLIPAVPSHSAVSTAPNVAAFDSSQVTPIIHHPLEHLEWTRDQIAAGETDVAGGGPGNVQWRTWEDFKLVSQANTRLANALANKSGTSLASRHFYSYETYNYTPTTALNTDNLWVNWLDDGAACLAATYRGIIESDSAALDAAVAGMMEWVGTCTSMSTLPSSGQRGKLYLHWGLARWAPAWALLLALDVPTTDEIVAVRAWLKNVPCKGSTDPESFDITGNTDSTLMLGDAAGNWQIGIATAQLDIGLLMDSVEGDALVAFSQTFFIDQMKSAVYSAANSTHATLGPGWPNRPNWRTEPDPDFEDTPPNANFLTTQLMGRYWSFADGTAFQNGVFEGQIVDYGRDQGHNSMTLSHIANYVLTWYANFGTDPLEGYEWIWDALASGLDDMAGILIEATERAFSNHSGDFNALDASTWTPLATYTTWGQTWLQAGQGAWSGNQWTTGAGQRSGPLFEFQNGSREGQIEAPFVAMDYLLRVVKGYDNLTNLTDYVSRIIDFPYTHAGTTHSRSVTGPNAGWGPMHFTYSSNHPALLWTANDTFDQITERIITNAEIPTHAAVATNPLTVAVPITYRTLTDSDINVHASFVAVAPTVMGTNGPSDPGTPSESPATVRFTDEGEFTATFVFSDDPDSFN